MTHILWHKRAALKGSVASAAIGIAMLAGPAAYAQSTAAADAVEAETIVVTGSLIKNPNLDRATPVTVTSADEIDLKQVTNAEQVLRDIPGIVPSIGSAVNNGNGGASFVDLRGLGSNRNVVLLDGQRLVPAELAGQIAVGSRVRVRFAGKLALQRNQILAHLRNGRYGGDIASDFVFPNNARDILAAEKNLGGIWIIGNFQWQIGCSSNYRSCIRRVHSLTQHGKSCYTVHGTSVDVLCIELFG